MARQPIDREDLLREATALVRRAAFQLPGQADEVIVGFRRDGAASVYFGADPVYQFTATGLLRRAYFAGERLSVHAGSLSRLTAENATGRLRMLAHSLTESETANVLTTLSGQLGMLREQLRAGRYRLVGQVPAEGDVVADILHWLEQQPLPPELAQRPHAE